jgi:8-oxo-dGTP diphosphatase
MDDIRAVDWLPLDAALKRLSRGYERTFLEHVGPLALAAAAPARLSRPARAKKQPAAEKRRRRLVVAPPVAPTISVSASPPTDVVPVASEQDQHPLPASASVEAETAAAATAPGDVAPSAEEIPAAATALPASEPQSCNHATAAAIDVRRINLVQKMREWLRRAA